MYSIYIHTYLQYEKFQHTHFGRCPRVYCGTQNVLPLGLSDNPRVSTVNVYCPKCQDIFVPRSTRQAALDGAYFGTTFAHLLLLTHADVIPAKPDQSYVPRIYGFKINRTSAYYTVAQQKENNGKHERKGGAGGGARSRGGSSTIDRRLSR